MLTNSPNFRKIYLFWEELGPSAMLRAIIMCLRPTDAHGDDISRSLVSLYYALCTNFPSDIISLLVILARFEDKTTYFKSNWSPQQDMKKYGSMLAARLESCRQFYHIWPAKSFITKKKIVIKMFNRVKLEVTMDS